MNSTLDRSDLKVNLEIIFGHIEVQSRMRPDGRRVIGEGRALHYDRNGTLTKDTGWKPTGVWYEWPEEPDRRWWEFWKC